MGRGPKAKGRCGRCRAGAPGSGRTAVIGGGSPFRRTERLALAAVALEHLAPLLHGGGELLPLFRGEHRARVEQRLGHALARGVVLCHHLDRKSTRLNSSHHSISYAVFCLKKKKT